MDQTPKSKVKKVNALHQKQKVFRQSDPILAVLMWGINHTMNELVFVPEQPLIMDGDFKASSKISVSNHGYNDSLLPSKYKIKEYCPIVFRDLRMRFGEDSEDFLASVCDGPITVLQSPGKSNSTFYKTHDSRILMKTLQREEVAQFHSIFRSYHSYIVERHGRTVLPHYLGMYRVTLDEKHTYLLVMPNIKSTTLPVQKVYDLKGSTVDRTASDKERQKESPTLKDNDFTTSGEKIELGADKERFMETLKADVEFLEKHKLMDYSLLVAIHEYEDDEAPKLDRDVDVYAWGTGGPLKQVYFMGIIDSLTKYGAKKMAAHTAKTAKHGGGASISTVAPDQYAKRFLEFIEGNTL